MSTEFPCEPWAGSAKPLALGSISHGAGMMQPISPEERCRLRVAQQELVAAGLDRKGTCCAQAASRAKRHQPLLDAGMKTGARVEASGG
ncbi:MAG: hypothetical protein H6816_07005 [Phycisphaerales bacterium]|nr:hypothetical protein [Phycisphaerales bacterium]